MCDPTLPRYGTDLLQVRSVDSPFPSVTTFYNLITAYGDLVSSKAIGSLLGWIIKSSIEERINEDANSSTNGDTFD